MKCIDEVPSEYLKGVRVFLRTGLNLPLAEDGSVGDIFRLRRGLPTVRYLVERGARVIIAGYFGREGASMRPVAEALMRLAPDIQMHFLGSAFSEVPREALSLKDGSCLILENLRRDPGEEKNDPNFAKLLASSAELFVDDALPEAHRPYASNVGIAAHLPSYAGLLMRDEMAALSRSRAPEHPSFAILGGAKFETKAPLIASLLSTYDHVFITGALANDVFKAQGLPVGRSLISKELPSPEILAHPGLLAPVDVTVQDPEGHARVKLPRDVIETDKIVDIGPDTIAHIAPFIGKAEHLLWNGPTGLYEEGFVSYTHAIAELIAKRVDVGATVVIGGGDTIAVLESCGIAKERLGFLSTGGGAMLEYLLKGTLPAIEVLQ